MNVSVYMPFNGVLPDDEVVKISPWVEDNIGSVLMMELIVDGTPDRATVVSHIWFISPNDVASVFRFWNVSEVV